MDTIKELLKRDLLSRPPHLLCSYERCQAILGHRSKFIGRSCPVCHIGRLEEVDNEGLIRRVGNKLNNLPYFLEGAK